MSVNIFDYPYKSLSELLIPVETFIQQIYYIERPPGKFIEILRSLFRLKNTDVAHGYIMPYPYADPVYNGDEHLRVLMQKQSYKLEEKIANMWISAIVKRIEPLLNNVVTIDTIQRFDQSKTDRAILHVFSGKVLIFDSTNTRLVNIISFNTYLNTLMSMYKETVEDSERYEVWRRAAIRQLVGTYGDQVVQFYNFRKNEKNYTIRGWQDDRPKDIADESAEYILLKYHRGDKIILAI